VGEGEAKNCGFLVCVCETASHDVAVRRTVVPITRPVPEDHGLLKCNAVYSGISVPTSRSNSCCCCCCCSFESS